jgi:hypothetical protein
MVNQPKLRSNNSAPRYKNGCEVPQTFDQAMKLDEKNGKTKWQEAINSELSQIKGITLRLNNPLSEYISSLMSSLMADTKRNLWPIDISLKSLLEWIA